MSERTRVLNYPKSLDTWCCCGERFTRFSGIIDHIEHHHFLYRYDIVGYFRSQQAFKYSCDKCNGKAFSFYTAMVHHLSRHVEHKILCLQCLVLHNEQGFHEHVPECNLVEIEFKKDGRSSVHQ